MTQTAPKVPWIISFQQKDLLTACWGSEKEANLLYHFLNKASWEAKNQGIESCKVISFKEEHDKILKPVPMAEGTLIKYLKRFNIAGYVSSGRYGNTFTVNVDAIKAAFTNPPEKPLSAPRGRPKGFKVSRIKKTKNAETLENNNETSIITEEKSEVSRISEHEEVSRLNEKVLSLELEVLSLKEKVLNLELLVLNLKLSETRESAPEALAEAKVSPQNALEMIQTDSEREGTYSAADNPAQSGTDVPAPAPDASDEPYRPDFAADKRPIASDTPEDTHAEQSGRDSLSRHSDGSGSQSAYSKGSQASSQAQTVRTAPQSTASATTTAVAPVGDPGYEKPVQATLTGATQQESARLEPRQEVLIERPAVPEMPLQSARWCAETLVQIVEAKLKKYYRETTRDKEIKAARRILTGDSELTRERFVLAYDERDDEWWHDHKGPLHVHHMAEKDRVHEMLDRIDSRNERKGSNPSSKPNQDTSKGYTLAVNDPNYNIDDDFYNNAAAWAAFDAPPKGGTVHV